MKSAKAIVCCLATLLLGHTASADFLGGASFNVANNPDNKIEDATIVYESATLGMTGQPGGFSINDEFLGSRFTLTDLTPLMLFRT